MEPALHFRAGLCAGTEATCDMLRTADAASALPEQSRNQLPPDISF